jgi:hypothetical protein
MLDQADVGATIQDSFHAPHALLCELDVHAEDFASRHTVALRALGPYAIVVFA